MNSLVRKILEFMSKIAVLVLANYTPKALAWLWRQFLQYAWPVMHEQAVSVARDARKWLGSSAAARLIAFGLFLTLSGLEGIQIAHAFGVSDAVPAFMFLFGILFTIKGYDQYGNHRANSTTSL